MFVEAGDAGRSAPVVTTNGLLAPFVSPLHPRKDRPASGAAVSVTATPGPKRLVPGFLVTEPKPSASTVIAPCPVGSGAKTAVIVGLAFVTVKMSGLFVPLAALPHSAK